MKLSVKIWKVTLTLLLLDMNASDGDIAIGLKLSWK